jgi:hypothetical protein
LREWRWSGGLRRALLLLAVAGLPGWVSGCTLERRGDPDGIPPLDTTLLAPDSLLEAPLPAPADPETSVRTTLEVFREATRVGDISLALQLLDSRAILLDDLVLAEGGPADLPATRGELLMELRRRHAEGLGIAVESSELRWAEETAVITSVLLLTRRVGEGGATAPGADPPPPAPADTLGRARETAVVRPTPEGWRILHLHRSLGPPPGG